MAAAGAAATTPSLDLFECQVCLEPMVERQPRTLSACNHTFCQLCLEQLVDRQNNNIVCPTCRRSTDVPKGDVTQLPRNFSLAKIKEWQEYVLKLTGEIRLKEAVEEEVADAQPCEICCHSGTNNNASSRCMQCCVDVCNICKDIHLSTPAFTGHCVTSISLKKSANPPKCDIHGKVVGLICFQCKKAICLVCSFSDVHQVHKEKISPWGEGFPRVMDSVQHQSETFKQDLEEFNKILKDSEKDLEDIDAALKDLSLKRKEIEVKTEEMNNIYRNPLLKIIGTLKFTKDTYSRYIKLANTSFLDYFSNEGNIMAEIDSAKGTALAVCNEYKNVQKISKQICLEESAFIHRRILKSDGNHATPSLMQEKQPVWVDDIPEDPKDFASVRFILMVKPGEAIIDQPDDMLQLDNHNVLVTDCSCTFLQQIDTSGHLVGRWYPQGLSDRHCTATSYGGFLYLANAKGITKVPLDLSQPGRQRCSSFKGANSLAAVSENKILLSTWSNKLFEFDFSSNSRKLLLANLNKPYYICAKRHEQGYKYFVTESDSIDGRILTAAENDQTYGILMSHLKNPRACCLTERDTLLVAEEDKNRVFEMTLDGIFIRNVLTQRQHKIRSPCGLAYRYPYLWLTESYENGGGAIKLFKIE